MGTVLERGDNCDIAVASSGKTFGGAPAAMITKPAKSRSHAPKANTHGGSDQNLQVGKTNHEAHDLSVAYDVRVGGIARRPRRSRRHAATPSAQCRPSNLGRRVPS